MKKPNILKSSEFHMDIGDVLHLLFTDESGDPITITLNSVSNGVDNIDTAPDAPVALDASDITSTGFTANWNLMENTLGFYLDVATDLAFTALVGGYSNLDVGLVSTYDVVGLSDATTYYYRLRGYNDYGTGQSSNIITLLTDVENVVDADGNVYTYVTIGTQQWMVENLKTTKYADLTPIPNITASEYTDWYLPSIDELDAMYISLHLFAVGSFASSSYWTSTEHIGANPDTNAHYQRFSDGVKGNQGKSNTLRVRACRSFTAVAGTYSLRDTGPGNGLIFYIDGTTFYEAAPSDQSNAQAWSNISNVEIGATAQNTAIGDGQGNTTAIIGQIGHTDSAAKLCDDLEEGGWINDTTGAYCYYDNDIANKTDYGALYNWYAVDNVHGLAPTGWRVPDDDNDWSTLIAFLGGASVAGGKLKEMGIAHWLTPNTDATDGYGFKGLPGGYRDATGAFSLIGSRAIFSTTDDPDIEALNYNDAATSGAGGNNKWGVSVRCMRDVI